MNYKIYQQLKKLYDANDFEKLLKDSNGLLFLKIRSIARKALLIEFAEKIGINPNQGTRVTVFFCQKSKTKNLFNKLE